MKGDNMTKRGRRKAKRESGKWPAKRSAEVAPPGERRQGTPTTHYVPKKVSWALAARKLQKAGWAPKKIARRLGVNVKQVEDVLDAHRTRD